MFESYVRLKTDAQASWPFKAQLLKLLHYAMQT